MDWKIKVAMATGLMVTGLMCVRADYRQAGYLYLSPVPGAEYTAPQTRFVLVRFATVTPADVTNLTTTFITVQGASSGSHTGQVSVATDGRTVIYRMTNDFTSKEVVTVSLNPQLRPGATGTLAPYQYQFAIAGPMPGSLSVYTTKPVEIQGDAQTNDEPQKTETDGDEHVSQLSAAPGRAGIMPNGVSVPSDFPHIEITVNDNPDSGYIFIDNRGGRGKPYNVIFDNTGCPIWYQRTTGQWHDMKVQPNGMLTMEAHPGGKAIGLNSNYVQAATYSTTNGYTVDEHELQVLADGSYYLIGARYNTVDMSRYVVGGKTNANVQETVIQGFTAAGELIFQWRAWDNYDIRDLHIESPLASSMTFPHMNSIEIDKDGHILVSSRNLSEVTKINKDTGEIIWRLGGAHSDFVFVNDPLDGFWGLHSVRATGTNRYILFDNGNLHNPPVSRAVEYELDLTNMTATLVWQYPATPTTNLFSVYMGNVQRLPNGNTLINWAVTNLPKLTEVRPDGTKAFEMNWVNKYETYRVWRYRWQGMTLKPYLIVESTPTNVVLLFNKFGDTNVAYYRVYGGKTPNPTNVVATSTVTMLCLDDLEDKKTYYFRVTAVANDGTESQFSDQVSTFVNIVRPGENMVQNGDFTEDTEPWDLILSGGASATLDVASGAGYVHINNPGVAVTDIQLSQSGLKLIQGHLYILQFDAWSVLPRYMEVRVRQTYTPGTTYEIFTPYITPMHNRFKYVFTMDEPSESNVTLSFNLGLSVFDVYLDNISFMMVAPGDFDLDGCVGTNDFALLATQWLQQGSGITADLNGDGKVDLKDFAIFGQNWLTGDCR